MDILCIVTKEHIPLALAEIEELLRVPAARMRDDAFIISLPPKQTTLIARLAFTHQASEIIFSCSAQNFRETLEKFPLKFKGSFAVKMNTDKGTPALSQEKSFELTPAAIGGIIWKKQKNPRVDLKNPDVIFDVVIAHPHEIYLCRRIFTNDARFNERKAHKRPVLHPSSMHPRLARCIVNLSSSKKAILDPLCGSGGILLEAGLLGLKITGIDIDAKLLESSKKNLEGYSIPRRQFTLIKGDSTNLTALVKETEAIVTDFPYGLHSKAPQELAQFYETMLGQFALVSARAVVVMPDFIDAEAIISKTRLHIRRRFSFYVHKSLTRMIFVLDMPA